MAVTNRNPVAERQTSHSSRPIKNPKTLHEPVSAFLLHF